MNATIIPQAVGSVCWSCAIVTVVGALVELGSAPMISSPEKERRPKRDLTVVSDSWNFAVMTSLSAACLTCAFAEKVLDYAAAFHDSGDVKVSGAIMAVNESSRFFCVNLWFGIFAQSIATLGVLYDLLVTRVGEPQIRQMVLDATIVLPYAGLVWLYEQKIMPLERFTHMHSPLSAIQKVQLVDNLETLSLQMIVGAFFSVLLVILPMVRFHLLSTSSAKIFVQVFPPQKTISQIEDVSMSVTSTFVMSQAPPSPYSQGTVTSVPAKISSKFLLIDKAAPKNLKNKDEVGQGTSFGNAKDQVLEKQTSLLLEDKFALQKTCEPGRLITVNEEEGTTTDNNAISEESIGTETDLEDTEVELEATDEEVEDMASDVSSELHVRKKNKITHEDDEPADLTEDQVELAAKISTGSNNEPHDEMSFTSGSEQQQDLILGSSLCATGLALSFWILRSLK